MKKVLLISALFGLLLNGVGCSKNKDGESGKAPGSGYEVNSGSGNQESKESPGSSEANSALVGKYKLILDTSEVPEAEKAMMEEFKKDLPELMMDFKADGTADLLAKGDNLTAKWTVNGDTVTVDPDNEGEPTATFKIEDDGKMLVPDATMKLEPIGKAVPKFEKQ